MLRSLALVGAAGLAGCGSEPAQAPPEEDDPDPCYEAAVTTAEPAGSAATDAYDIGEAGTLNLLPVDETQPPSSVFERYNGEIDAALDLRAAYEKHRLSIPGEWDTENRDLVRDFRAIVAQAMEEGRSDFAESINEQFRRRQPRQYDIDPSAVEWSIYFDESRPFDERLADSGLVDQWYRLAYVRTNLVGPVHMWHQAKAYQLAERRAGFDTVIWHDSAAGSSNTYITAIAGASRTTTGADAQRTYDVGNHPNDEPQVRPWTAEAMAEDRWHPALSDEEYGLSLYKRTVIDGPDDRVFDRLEVSDELERRFRAFCRSPQACPAYTHLDAIVAAAYVAEKNWGTVELDVDAMRLRR